MPEFALGDYDGGGPPAGIAYSVETTLQSPADAYDAWAAELGVSSTATLKNLDGFDTAWAIDLAAAFFPGGATKAMFATGAGIGFYRGDPPSNTSGRIYSLDGVARFKGLESAPDLILSFQTVAYLQSYSVKLQRSGTTAILFAKFSKRYTVSDAGYDAAIRIDGGQITFVGYAYDTPARVCLHDIDTRFDGAYENEQELIAEQEPYSTILLTAAFAVLPTRAEVLMPALMARGNVEALARFGALPAARVQAPSTLGAGAAVAMARPVALARLGAALGAPRSTAVFVPQARIAAQGVLGPVSAITQIDAAALVAAPSPLAHAKAVGHHDFTGQLGDPTTLFVMDLVTPTGSVRVPISSWQATLQTGSSNYVQCVIPACAMWTEAINAATEFVIYRRAVLPSGKAIEYEMARAPAGAPQFDRGPQRHTCTLSGYSDAFADSAGPPPAAYDRALTGVRSISSGSSYRVRCAVDWLLRPGHRAFVSGAPFVVKFINYYAPSEWDSYMDVGG